MIRGVYSSASGLAALLQRQELISQNLANVSTAGYKQEFTLLEGGPESALMRLHSGDPNSAVGPLISGVDGSGVFVDHSQGPLESTQRPLDMAIIGDGYFMVQTPDGVRLTRDGTFHQDSTGGLVTADGYQLLGANGAIQLPEGIPTIAEDGSIYMPGGAQPVARIVLAGVANPETLVRGGQNLLDPTNSTLQPIAAGNTSIKQGMIENSNIDSSSMVVSMMQGLRSYEAIQRSLKLQDETLQRSLEIARVG